MNGFFKWFLQYININAHFDSIKFDCNSHLIIIGPREGRQVNLTFEDEC